MLRPNTQLQLEQKLDTPGCWIRLKCYRWGSIWDNFNNGKYLKWLHRLQITLQNQN